MTARVASTIGRTAGFKSLLVLSLLLALGEIDRVDPPSVFVL